MITDLLAQWVWINVPFFGDLTVSLLVLLVYITSDHMAQGREIPL